MAARIRKGDTVVVISGRDKGKKGTVLRILAAGEMVVVEGLNMVTKHQKPTQRAEGKRFQREAALHACKVMPVDPSTGKGTRVRMKLDGERKVRTSTGGTTLG